MTQFSISMAMVLMLVIVTFAAAAVSAQDSELAPAPAPVMDAGAGFSLPVSGAIAGLSLVAFSSWLLETLTALLFLQAMRVR
ncbi:hypothetical protein OIU78_019883 [Salix suchowensis]|nr:hypothetical protein OIU78_019883 [Salix suchowensis]